MTRSAISLWKEGNRRMIAEQGATDGSGNKKDDFLEKFQRGGGVSFSIQNLDLDFGPLNRALFGKKMQYDCLRMREGGGQRPFETFPKIRPFWSRHLSLSILNFWEVSSTLG